MTDLPTGTVTFLFTDIEGSTRLLQRLGSPRYATLRAEHYRLVRAACAAHDGREVDTQGDAFFVAFPTASGALDAAAQAQRTLAAQPWPDGTPVQVRMGLHTGTPLVTPDGGYVGLDVVRAARIAAAGHGGQVLLSDATRVLTEQALPEGITLRDLGAHRLKDLQRPEHLSQLVLPDLPADFPPLKSLDRHPHNLPVQPTVLLGREDAVAGVCALLRRNDVRLVTLTGPGGVGKTRLGLQVAAELVDEYPDGVWFVRLSMLTDPALVLATIAQTLGLREMGSQSSEEILREYVRTRHLLLLLDNFEQVVGAAVGVAELLETSPGLKVVVTSRTVLHLRGEREVPVPPLGLPSAAGSPRLPPVERLSQYAAVALFVERARDARPDFHLTHANAPVVTEICARLDGLPLAIELAAARVKLLPPPALLQLLEHQLALLTGGARDLEERQQTMRATLAWSEALLAPAEQVLFRRLAVFVGGCTLEAAEAVCAAPEGAEPLGMDILEGLGALVDHSLVQQREEDSEPRFSLLQVIREYALEQLGASGELDAMHRAHSAYYARLGDAAELHLWGWEQATWVAQLEREHANLRAALRWLRDHREVVSALRLAVAIGNFWFIRSHYEEGARWLEDLLAQPDTADPVLRVRALYRTWTLIWMRRDRSKVETLAEEALTLARVSADVEGRALALQLYADAAVEAGQLDQAVAYGEQAVEAARQAGVRWTLGNRLQQQGYFLLLQGALERAQAAATEGRDLLRAQGDEDGQAMALITLGAIACRQGDAVSGRQHVEEALELYQRLAHPAGMTASLLVLAGVAALEQRFERAGRLLGCADSALGHSPSYTYHIQQTLDAVLAPARAALGEEAWAAAFAAGRALTMEEAIAEALDATSK